MMLFVNLLLILRMAHFLRAHQNLKVSQNIDYPDRGKEVKNPTLFLRIAGSAAPMADIGMPQGTEDGANHN